MRAIIVVLVGLMVLLAGCALLERDCGNGVCEGWESHKSCPKDCEQTIYKGAGQTTEENANG